MRKYEINKIALYGEVDGAELVLDGLFYRHLVLVRAVDTILCDPNVRVIIAIFDPPEYFAHAPRHHVQPVRGSHGANRHAVA